MKEKKPGISNINIIQPWYITSPYCFDLNTVRIKIDLVKHLVLKTSEKNFAQRFDDSNDDMESSKRCAQFFTLVFITKC